MYDYKRSENYNCDNCKHLACTEVRAALFHSQCNPRERYRLTSMSGYTKTALDKMEANEFCVREKATEHIKERDKCAEKADRYINYVFDKCKNDTAPFSAARRRVKTLTNIL